MQHSATRARPADSEHTHDKGLRQFTVLEIFLPLLRMHNGNG